MSTCPKCGSNLNESTKFCPECGAPVVEQPESITQQQKSPAPPTSSEIPGPSKESSKVPFYKKKPFIIVVIAIVVLIVFGSIGIGNSSSSTNAASSTSSSNAAQSSSSSSSSASSTQAKKTLADILASSGSFEAVTLTGSGDDVLDIPCAGKPCLMTIEHDGTRNFVVHTVNSSGSNIDLLVNEIGPYSGVVTDWSKYQNATTLSITADGAWSVTFEPMSSVHVAENGETFTGPNVVGIDVDKISKISFTHDGTSNFSVKGIGTSKSKLLVNEIGAYQGTVVWSDPQAFFIVEADGNWSISW